MARFVLLLVASFACGLNAQQGYSGYSQDHGHPQAPQILTCINQNEARDQLRVTLRPELSRSSQYGYGRQQSRDLTVHDWRISVVYVSATSLGLIVPPGTASLVGQFFVAVTRNGRTEGRCAGLGGILMRDDLLKLGNNGYGNSGYGNSGYGNLGFGNIGNMYGRYPGIGGQSLSPFSSFGLSKFASPFSSFGSSGILGGLGGMGLYNRGGAFGGQYPSFGLGGNSLFRNSRPSPPPGLIANPIVISQGGNVYSDVIRQVREADLRGRAIALCLDPYCTKPTTTCCTIANDQTAATDNVGAYQTGPVDGNVLLNQNNNNGIGNNILNGGINNNINNGLNLGGNNLIGNNLLGGDDNNDLF